MMVASPAAPPTTPPTSHHRHCSTGATPTVRIFNEGTSCFRKASRRAWPLPRGRILRHQHRLQRKRPADAHRLRQRSEAHLHLRPLDLPLGALLTRRDPGAFPGDSPIAPTAWPGCDVHNLHYTYDPIGNITYILDDAQQTIYFRNKRSSRARLHLRRHLPADRGHRPRASGASRRFSRSPTPAMTPAGSACCIRATVTPWGAISSATSTMRSAISRR